MRSSTFVAEMRVEFVMRCQCWMGCQCCRVQPNSGNRYPTLALLDSNFFLTLAFNLYMLRVLISRCIVVETWTGHTSA